MNKKRLGRWLLAGAMTMVAGFSHAAIGTFVTLPEFDASVASNSTNPVNTVPKLTKSGQPNNAIDPLFLGAFTSGATVYGKVPSNLVLLDSRTTETLPFTNAAGTPLSTMGTFYDAVYRDINDDSLIFASRIELSPTSGVEINDVFRKGFAEFTLATGSHLSVAWSAASNADFRLRSGTRSAQGLLKLFNASGSQTGVQPRTYDADTVALSTDTSAPESNPVSGWYFIKVTDTQANDTDHILGYELQDNAVGLYRGNDEPNGAVTTLWIRGFVPVITSAAPVPEPSEWALLVAGLVVTGWVARRRLAA